MFVSLKRLWQHISPRRRRQFGGLLVLMVITSFAEVFSIGAVIPFLGVLTSPERIFGMPVIQPLIKILQLENPGQLLLPITIFFGLAAFVAGGMRLIFLWVSTKVSFGAGADLSINIYQRTLYQPYVVHCSRNSSEVINGISGYSGETIAACGLGGRSGAGAILAKSIKVGLAKGSSNIVEIKITGASPEAAKSCASAIFEQIRATQEQAFEPYKRGLELKIAEDELKLNRVKKDEFKSNSADLNRDASILWAREEIAFLLREISSAKMILRSSKYQLAQLVSPIFTSDESTRPKKTIVLLTGIFGGLFLGLLILLASKLWAAIFKYVEYGDNEMENVES
jgi:hypothetical protein